jgi:predicted esterase
MRPLLIALLFATPLFAQADRYELGRRVHDFEVAWDDQGTDAAAKKRAAPLVNEAVQSFFRLSLAGAAEKFDAARHALDSPEVVPLGVLWAEALQIVPEARAVDAATETVQVTVKPFYKVEGEAPKGAVARAKLGAGKPVEVALDKLPATLEVPVKSVPGTPSADFPLVVEIVVDGKTLSRKETRLSRIEKFAERLDAVKKLAAEVKDPTTIEQATFLLLVQQLEDAAAKKTPETDYPYSRLIFGAERLSKVTEPYYIPKRGGEFWLSIPVEKKATVVRIRIPPKLEEKKSVGILFALHGMGGSENLFFDAYGNGIVPRLATERGWIVVAPRVEGVLGAGPAPNVVGILDELAKRYPIDPKQVFVVGHSMGAGHALQIAQKNPERFTAVAALGGGGLVKKGEDLKGVRFFVGCGQKDFALPMAKALHKSLQDAGVPATFKEYPDIEHLLIVREAAEDVFKFFDEVAKK